MGDITDMILDGDLCECCGEYIGGGDGFARLCHGCRHAEEKEKKKQEKVKTKPKGDAGKGE